ncbi:MAG: hypothetical protein H6621_07070 [Halobacteriovoraceae bacterium]|nr:hypothetical protein [Halobacteriovoraceae bacterium]
MFKLLASLIILLSSQAQACPVSGVVGELSNWHDANWSLFMKKTGCTREQIKENLKRIIDDPNSPETLGEYKTKSFIYNKAISFLGNFTDFDPVSGGLDQETKDYLKDLYENLHEKMQGLFPGVSGQEYNSMVNSVKYEIVETIKNTGSLEALELYSDFLKNETDPFLAKSIVEYADILRDKYEVQQFDKTDDRRDSEQYYPNLDKDIYDRFTGVDDRLIDEAYQKFGLEVDSFVTKNKDKSKYPAIFNQIELMRANKFGLNGENDETRAVAAIAKEDDDDPSGSGMNSSDEHREPQGEDETSSGNNFFFILFGMILVLGIIVFIKKSVSK